MLVDEAYIREHFLDKKEAITINEQSLDNQLTDQKAFNKIERLIAVRDRAIEEVRVRLSQEGYNSDVAKQAIDRAIACGYLDDERFAEFYIRSRINAGKGLEGIVRHLKHLKIDPSNLEGFPYRFLPEDYDPINAACTVLQKKPPRSKNKRQAAYAKLMREGYSSSDAYQAVL